VLSSVPGSSPDLAEHLVTDGFFREPEDWKAIFVEDFSFAIARSNKREDVQHLLNVVNRPVCDHAAWRLAALKGLSKGMEKAGSADAGLKEFLKEIKTDTDEQVRASLSSIGRFYDRK
jgi:hypothetical protein